MAWISCKEKLPEKDITVLVYQESYIFTAEYWYDIDGVPVFMDPPHAPYKHVTHWMPLPEPPYVDDVHRPISEIFGKI